jgi:hypothetical protein
MHTKFLWRNVNENIQLLIRIMRWGRSEIGVFCDEGLDGTGSGTCPKFNLSVQASLLMLCIFAHTRIYDPYSPTFHDFWLSPLNYWLFIFHLKTFLNQRVINVLISKRITLYGCTFVAGFKTRAPTEAVRERVQFQRNRVEDRSLENYVLRSFIDLLKTKLNSVALVRERTIPTERPPPVGEVSANFCG